MDAVQSWRNGTVSGERIFAEMVRAAHARADRGEDEMEDGWRRPLRTSPGFHYIYRNDVGRGGWDFHYLTDALSLAVVDFTAARSMAHLHRNDDHLVFSAVLEGRSVVRADEGLVDMLSHGFCTVTSLAGGSPVHTVYEAGRAHRWVSVFLRRDKIRELCGLDPSRLPAIFRDDIVHRMPLGLRSVPLTGAASMAATQVFDCRYRGELRRMYLIAKAIEIVCAVIDAFAQDDRDDTPLSDADADKVRLARAIIKENLDDPLSVHDLARVVGLSKHKLQLGFQTLFATSVGRLYRQVRLAKAMALVSDTRLSMIEIAFECGYEHPGSFTRAFISAFGTSPSRARAMAKRRA